MDSRVFRHGHIRSGRIHRIAARHYLQQERRVLHRLSERSRMVERRGEGNEAVPRDASVGRHQADHAAKCRRLADGAAGVGADRGHGSSRRNRSRRPAGRAAGNARKIARIVYRVKAGVFIRRAHGELVAVGLAENDRARLLQPRHNRRVVGSDEALQNLRARRRPNALGGEDILHRDRHARQRRQLLARVGQLIHASRLLISALFGQRQVSADRAVLRGDLGVELVHQRCRRRLPFSNRYARRSYR